MRLYHGSTLSIEKPDISHSRGNLDFGKGFYLTSIPEQARRWALRKASLERSNAVMNVFEMSDDISELSVLRFSENDEAWVEFVCRCRRGDKPLQAYDLIIGGVADDRVYEAVNMYYKGYWDMKTTLSALKFYDRNDQYYFATQKAIDQMLSFVESYGVEQ